ncbi:glycerophosphodiester phosphodiesterase [Listeria ivanovii]|uniref:Putative glycerophosphodiester phosphodiesterase n=1 Tax=Listeria ivanovii (strain ATCC BAA-678 / PAM 55) TaxID=881621 RepID=G2ZFK8_LISIP|nr:glycerophosphodiester phosphodiesterase [Listeria ivanovii]AHI55789.1 glycerophosphoryl diester phosphodiesterase [Listeria ivanovii WSLC3009]AIS65233.1 glycerophosphodiester phosphodiesterase [Listeria ivanovii subsp. ivanovii]MBC1760107.1 glycerophosphodiester phosphodiesterase [Listeria ivanovii]MBK3914614.1 glycerophosphodiester phosphodiesterase [Listeria ivanovii subsp. ivanovii]MBK3921488.1 glycerophosphodiester phosphodiesterase [Listeria ivanovii subsp. ivanovii]
MTEVFAHRGSSGTHPENSLPAMKEAINSGADGIELDIHVLKTGELIVMHDEKVDRTTNGSGYLKDFTLSEVKKLAIGNRLFRKVCVPTLEEVFTLIEDSGVILNIELKTDIFEYQGIEQKVVDLGKKYPNVKVMYSSFNPHTLVRLRELDRTSRLALITHENLDAVLDLHKKIQLDAVHPPIQAKDTPILKEIPARYWTVNKEEDMTYFCAIKAKGIMTDFPERAVAIRKTTNNQ